MRRARGRAAPPIPDPAARVFSDELQRALSREVIGQPRAVESVVRGVTRLASGLTPVERSWCAYLFIGPPGTGRAHLVRTLARVLHGREALFTLDCNPGGHSDWWAWVVEQLMPLFARHEQDRARGHAAAPSILLVRDLECAPKSFYPTLACLLETGELALPGGRRGRLGDSLVFLTSGLCTEQILDTSRLGFSGTSAQHANGEGEDALHAACRAEAEKAFGLELLAQIDDIVLFRRLESEHLARVLAGHFERMSRWLDLRGIHSVLRPSAHEFLLRSGAHRPWRGARDLVVAHRQEVEFPLADLLVSRCLRPGRSVVIEHRPGEAHLHFTLEEEPAVPRELRREGIPLEIPVE